MSRPSRRFFLKGLAASAAAAGASGLVPGILRRRASAQSTGAVYPTVFIMLGGGVDIVMHFDARTGFVNRNVQAGDIRETPGGIRWYEPVLSSMTNHIQDCTLIRNISCTSSHHQGKIETWFGEQRAEDAATAMPWASYMTDELLKRQGAVAPNITTYIEQNGQPHTNFINWNNRSPSPLATAQRVLRIPDLASGLDVTQGQPDPDYQARVFQHVAAMDSNVYSPAVQSRMLSAFSAANSQATELLSQPVPPIWPPDNETAQLFNLDDRDIGSVARDNNHNFQAHLALAFTMARYRLSHSIYIQSTNGGWDTHNNHDAGQRRTSAASFPEIDRFLSALKATESPIEPGQTMLDTTHVVITSELSRSNSIDNGEDNDGLGTTHWPWTQAVLIGGRFKRDYTFGDMDGNLQGVPADFDTGQLGVGRNPTFKELHATILAANGVDPSGWSAAPPINAVLK